MEEEEDGGIDFLFGEDEVEAEEAATYNHLLQAETSRRRRRSDAPPKVIRPRDLPSSHRRIKADYFVADPVYNDKQFRRRFRMRRHLFKHIKEAVKNHDDNYFRKRCDATGKEGLSALQKCVASMRILAYGVPADAVDEYVRIGESTARAAALMAGDDGHEEEIQSHWKYCESSATSRSLFYRGGSSRPLRDFFR